MFILVKLFGFDTLLISLINFIQGLNTIKTLVWVGLASNTRQKYQTGIRLYNWVPKVTVRFWLYT